MGERRRRPEGSAQAFARKESTNWVAAPQLDSPGSLVCPYVDSPQAGRRSRDLSIIPLPSRASRHKFGRKQMVDGRGRGRSVGASQTGGSFLFVADVAKRFATAPPGDSSRRDGSSPFPPFRSSFPVAHSSDTGIGFMTEPSLAIEMK